MARKRHIVRNLLVLGGAAAVGYAVYQNRDVLRSFLEELTAAPAPRDTEGTVIAFESAAAEPEADIVIDRTAEPTEPSVREC